MKCAIFLADGFEECEGLITVDMLRRGGVTIDMISMMGRKEIAGSRGIHVLAEYLYEDIDPEDYDVLILPGGKIGTENLDCREDLKEALKRHFQMGKLTAAICAAPSVLGHAGILQGRHYTCSPGFESESYQAIYEKEMAVTDGNLITARGMGATIEFSRHILQKLIREEELAEVERGIQYEHRFIAER